MFKGMHVRDTLLFAGIFGVLLACSSTLPVLDDSAEYNDNGTLEEQETSFNDTPKDLYVVKAVVYEVGILTDAADNDTSSFESQERVDLTFYDAHTNESHIDLGSIPLPVQTNVSGQVLTGIAPVKIGAFSSPEQLIETLPLTGSVVNITRSNTTLYQFMKSNDSYASGAHVLQADELAQLPNITQSLHLQESQMSTAAPRQHSLHSQETL